MFDRKAVLYVLLGITIFMLFDAWQKDHGAKRELSGQTDTTIVVTDSGVPRSLVKEIERDEPTLEKQRNTIRVTTDVLDVVINLEGGNIEEASLLKYPRVMNSADSVQLLSTQGENFYVTRSSWLGMGKQKNGYLRYVAKEKHYKLKQGQEFLQVRLDGVGENAAMHCTYKFFRNSYAIQISHEIDNRSNKAWQGSFCVEIRRKNLEAQRSMFQLSTYAGAAVSSPEKPYEKVSFSNIEDIMKNRGGVIRKTAAGWIAMQQRYFLTAWVPEVKGQYTYFGDVSGDVYAIGFLGEKMVVAPETKQTLDSTLYIGPEIAENLAPIAKGLERTVDYGWLWIIAVGLFWILKQLYIGLGNWGLAIILITVLIKLVFYKFSESSGRSMAKMKELMPRMQTLKERYANDRQGLHQATMELYKREGVNPMNLGGCLPMLIQIPFFIALYYVLVNAVELRQAPFMLWIHDLAAQDPYYVLPILMGLSMLLQQKISPSSLDPTQTKVMMIMPLVFTFLFATFPAGLVLYWLVNNVLSVLQQWYINRRLERESVQHRRK